jgi:hypothetical protein
MSATITTSDTPIPLLATTEEVRSTTMVVANTVSIWNGLWYGVCVCVSVWYGVFSFFSFVFTHTLLTHSLTHSLYSVSLYRQCIDCK